MDRLHLRDIYFMGMHLMGVYLMGAYPMGIHLMGISKACKARSQY